MTPEAITAPFSAGHGLAAVTVPGKACDCHVHVYNARFPSAPGARLHPPDASADDYRRLQRRLGTQRVVLVTPSTYGTDNRCMLEGLAALGPRQARGVAVLDGSESDGELRQLHARGVRGVRINLSLGVVGSAGMLAPLADRIAPLGWHLQLLLPPDLLVDLAPVVERLPVALVFDHFARISPPEAGVHPAHDADIHPAHELILDLLRKGRAWVKLSGGYIVSPLKTVMDPALDALACSYLRAAPRRTVWGSDWPHATASAGVQPMPDDARQLERLAEWVGQAGQGATLQRVLVDNPAELYDFDTASPSTDGSGAA